MHLLMAYGLFEFGDNLLQLFEFVGLGIFVYHKYSSFFVIGCVAINSTVSGLRDLKFT